MEALSGLRVAAVVVGAIGALTGMMKGLLSILIWVLMWFRLGEGVLNAYTYLLWGANALLVASCIVALVGALQAGRGSLRMGATLLLASIAGIAAAVVLFAVVQANVVAPRNPGMPGTPNALFYVSSLAPVPLLLFAAVLSLFARRAEGRTGPGGG